MSSFLHFFISVLISMVIMVVYILTRGRPKMKIEKIIEKAEKDGTTAVAVLENCRESGSSYEEHPNVYPTSYWIAEYRYEVNGVLYHHTWHMISNPPQSVKIYYPSGKPNKPMIEGELKYGFPYVRLCLGMLLLLLVVYKIVGLLF